MATAQEIQVALANEARRSELRSKVAALRGAQDATAALINRMSVINSDTGIQLADALAQLQALEAGDGPGITDSFGPKSIVTQFVESERTAAKSASIDFVKANVECTEQEAADAWDVAAIAAHPTFTMPIQGGLAIGRLYRANLLAGGYITEDTWEAQRAWILATPKAAIMAA